MHKHIMEKWVAELRSGKYWQQRGRLKGPDGFCCLGVLCDIHRRESTGWEWAPKQDEIYGGKPELPYYQNLYESSSCALPNSVQEWAGLRSAAPEVEISSFSEAESDVQRTVRLLARRCLRGLVSLDVLNDGTIDGDRLNFEQIADVIEQNYPTL